MVVSPLPPLEYSSSKVSLSCYTIARTSPPPPTYRAKGHLAQIAAEAAIHGTARCVIRSYAPPDGLERAHLFGRAAS